MNPFLDLDFLLAEKPQVLGVVAAINLEKVKGGQILFIHRQGRGILGVGAKSKY
ncbi:MAG TPA: hypothetical protein VGM89_08150 [Puia sp.]